MGCLWVVLCGYLVPQFFCGGILFVAFHFPKNAKSATIFQRWLRCAALIEWKNEQFNQYIVRRAVDIEVWMNLCKTHKMPLVIIAVSVAVNQLVRLYVTYPVGKCLIDL